MLDEVTMTFRSRRTKPEVLVGVLVGVLPSALRPHSPRAFPPGSPVDELFHFEQLVLSEPPFPTCSL